MSRCSPAPKLPTRYLPCRYAHSTLDHGGAETLQSTCQPRHPAPRVPITTTNTSPPFLRPGVRGLTTVYDCVLTSASNIASQDSPGPAYWSYTHTLIHRPAGQPLFFLRPLVGLDLVWSWGQTRRSRRGQRSMLAMWPEGGHQRVGMRARSALVY